MAETPTLGRLLRPAALAVVPGLVLMGCSDDPTDPDSDPGPDPGDAEPLVLEEIAPADQVEFDVEWEPGTEVAEEQAVLNDVEDLMAYDGVYRVDPESSLLDGLEVGDVVVWPQLGIFDITGIEDQGDVVEVETEWARFSDAVQEAEIHFSHALSAGEPGRAVGVAPAGSPPPESGGDGVAYGLTGDSGPVEITEDGVEFSHDAGGYEVELGASGSQIDASINVGGDNASASLNGSVQGVQAEGIILLDEDGEDEDPAIGLHFEDLQVDVEGVVEVSDSRGEVTIQPDAVIAFPISIGPIPGFIAIGTRLQIRSSISRVDTDLSASAGFTVHGDVSLGRNPDGGFGAEGTVHSFDATGPEFSFQTSNTAGLGLDFDTPRVTFGLGRPGASPAVVYGAQSAELTANVHMDPDGHCAVANTNGAITAGGEINAFVWSASQDYVIAQQDGPSAQQGDAC